MIVLYLLLSHLLLSQCEQNTSRLPSYYASLADIPYHVLIVYDNLYCSGGLIRSKIVITAASCLVMAESSTVIVKVGAQVTTDFSQVIEVIEVKKHEYYGVRSEIDNDIALLMLKEHVNFNSLVSKVIISDDMIRIGVGAPVNVSGWGTGTASTDVKFINKLLNSEMVIVSNPECEHQYLKLKTMANFCVRYQVNQFLSDNGGPAVYDSYLAGILSYGADKNKDPYLALITNVSYFHNWIQLNVDRLMKKYCVISVEDDDYYYESYSYAYSSDDY